MEKLIKYKTPSVEIEKLSNKDTIVHFTILEPPSTIPGLKRLIEGLLFIYYDMNGKSSMWEDQARLLVDQNKVLEAVKLVKETTGMGLKESKEWVEQNTNYLKIRGIV